jgi:arylsulfatase A-like enzyme
MKIIIFGLVTLFFNSSQSLYTLNSPDSFSKPPNFIIVIVDDQGWNGTSVQMSDEIHNSKSDFHLTPNLEKLALKGMRFSSAYASAPVCAPSRYSIQFGQTPARLQMIRVGMNTDHINHNELITIPKILNRINSEYKSAHFGKWGMGSEPSVLGYHVSDGKTKNKDGGFDYKNNKRQWQNNLNIDPKLIFSTTQKAINFINEQVKSDTPFFVQISHYAVHSDIMMRKGTLEKYKNIPKGKYHNHIGFAAMTEDLDSGLGLLLNHIEKLGINENTYVIYTSDNGAVPAMPPKPVYSFSTNYPLKRGKWDATEGGIRVPFIISGPKIKSGIESKVKISLSDILPTVADLAGYKYEMPDNIDGGSFKNVLFNNGKGTIDRLFDYFIFHVPYENAIAYKRAHSSIIDENYKLLKFYDNDELKLFDISVDFEEKNSLHKKLPKIASSLEEKLNNYLKMVKAPKWKPGITWRDNKPIQEINSFH